MAGYKRIRGRDVQVLGLDPRQVQAAQREQMDRLKRAVEQNADAVYITDPTGRIEYVNPAFEALTGFSRAEAVGRPAAFLNADDPGLQAWPGAPLQAGKTFSALVVQRRKQGETFHAEIGKVTPRAIGCSKRSRPACATVYGRRTLSHGWVVTSLW